MDRDNIFVVEGKTMAQNLDFKNEFFQQFLRKW